MAFGDIRERDEKRLRQAVHTAVSSNFGELVEREVMEILVDIASGWQMRLREIESEEPEE